MTSSIGGTQNQSKIKVKIGIDPLTRQNYQSFQKVVEILRKTNSYKIKDVVKL